MNELAFGSIQMSLNSPNWLSFIGSKFLLIMTIKSTGVTHTSPQFMSLCVSFVIREPVNTHSLI